MKILFISMPSIHFIRWIEGLDELDAELYWFDILDRGSIETKLNIHQFVNWKKRKNKVKGVDFIRRNIPKLHSKVQSFYEVTIAEELERIIGKIKPDVIHSFEMQSCSYPILNVMKDLPNISWVYSCWGSDLYYYRDKKHHKKKITKTLKRVDYLHTDNTRDFDIAKDLGFSGKFLGVIPGGGGYDIENYQNYRKPHDERRVILVKGYEHKFGRALSVLQALLAIKDELKDYNVVVFGAHKRVVEYVVKNNLPFKTYYRHELDQEDLIRLMGESLIYIGNSVSDGMPNTLIEAIVMGAFPIQSNPGNVTAEVINDGLNGLLISNPEDIQHITAVIKKALNSKARFKNSALYNYDLALKKYNYKDNQNSIINIYKNIALTVNA